MKKAYYFLSILAATAALTACSSDDVTNSGTPDGGTEANTYMNVRISLPGTSTRAASRAASSSGYEAGEQAEYTVKSARFLFYDENGAYKTFGNTLTNITQENSTSNKPTAGQQSAWNSSNTSNIESTIGATVVLGPTTIKGPLKMVTLLNYSADKFNSLIGKSFEEMLKVLATGTPAKEGDFEMSSSAYVDKTGDESSSNGAVQYTYVPTSKFYTKAEDAVKAGESENSNNYVTAYVERTVAKTGMAMASSNTTTASEATSNKPYVDNATNPTSYIFPIKRTGDTSTDNASTFTVDDADGNLAVKILGWTVNGYNTAGWLVKHITYPTSSSSTPTSGPYYYIVKTLGTTQASQSSYSLTAWPLSNTSHDGSGWNNTNDHRSYWAEDVNYGTEAASISNSTSTPDKTLKDNDCKLQYNSYKDFNTLSEKFPKYQYVYENTVAQADARYKGGEQSPNVTCMLVIGQLGKWDAKDSNSKYFTELTNNDYIFRINGVYYTTNYLKKLITSHYYSNASSSSGTQNALGESNVAFSETTETSASTVSNEATTPEVTINLKKATKSGASNKESLGDIDFTVIVSGNIYLANCSTAVASDAGTAVATYLKTQLHITDGTEIECYKGGHCYYQVPIEQPAPASNTTGVENNIYGVVRNHNYKLTLSSVTNIGDPIFDEEKKIEPIPGSDDYYYVGADINVLEWREVDQKVDL